MALGSSTPIGEAWIRIRPTATGFEAEVMKEVGPAVKAAEKNLSIKPTADTSKATGPLGLLQSKIQSFAGKSPLADSLKSITSSSGEAGGALSSLASGPMVLAVGAITAFAAKGVAEFSKVTAEVRGFQRVVGTTAEESSRFVAAFKAVGIAPEAASMALGRFTRILATNAGALKAHGVAIAKNKDGTTDVKNTFLNLADAVSKSTDTTTKNALVIQAFGRAGLSLLPILNKGRDGINGLFGEADKHGTLFSQKDLDSGKELAAAMRNLKEAISGAFISAGRVVAPFVTDLERIAGDVVDLVHKFPLLAAPLKVAFAPLMAVIQGIHLLASALDAVTGAHNKAAAAAADGADATAALSQEGIDAATAIDKETQAETDHQKALESVQTALTAVVSAQKAQDDATSAVRDKTAALADAQKDLSKLLSKGAVDAKAVTSAQRGLESATKSLTMANRDFESSGQGVEDAHQAQLDALDAVTAAEQKLEDLRSGRTAAKDMVGHEHDLEHAQLGVRSATLAQQAAAKKLSDLQMDASSTTDELAAAQLDLDEANLRVTESTENVTKTQDELTRIENEGKEGSQTLADAQTDLDGKQKTLDGSTRDLMAAYLAQQDAADKVVTATQGVAQAQADLNAAQVGDVDFADKVVDARKKVQKADEDLRDARFDLSQKAADLLTAQEKEKTVLEGSREAAQELVAKYRAMEEQAPKTKAALDPLIALLTQQLVAAPPLPGTAPPAPPAPAAAAKAGRPAPSQSMTLAEILTFGVTGGMATGGFKSGSFMTGEQGPERVTLLSSGGAYITPAHRVATSGGGGGGAQSIAVNITASFGPGSGYDDVMRGMHDVATGVMTESLQRIVAKAAAR